MTLRPSVRGESQRKHSSLEDNLKSFPAIPSPLVILSGGLELPVKVGTWQQYWVLCPIKFCLGELGLVSAASSYCSSNSFQLVRLLGLAGKSGSS